MAEVLTSRWFWQVLLTPVPLAGAALAWQLFRALRYERGPGLSRAERTIAICSVMYVGGVILFAAIMAGTGKLVTFLYRNPVYYVPFRFAVTYLLGVPIALALRTRNLRWPRATDQRLETALLIAVTFIATALLAFMSLAHTVFGYVPSFLINPRQVIIPSVLAILVHLVFSIALLRDYSRRRRILSIMALPVAVALCLWLVTWPVNLWGFRYHRQLGTYLSSKYGLDHSNPHRFLDGPDAPVVVNEQVAPFAMILRYLVFGERAVDHSAIFD